MSRLVSDLQTLTKSNQPDFVALEKVDLSQFNDELFVKAEALAERAWVPSETVCDENLEIDRQRITQAVLQLADNACKQTTDNDQLEVGVDCGEGYVAFFVADSGPGIAVSEREKIKKRFARGNNHSERGEGSGLGLAVVGAIATAHGGYLRIDESKFGGAWVGIVLPRGSR
jgi:signal transduction histidine kinase